MQKSTTTPAKGDLDIDRDTLKLLMEVGFTAAASGMITRSQEIFDGIAAARPNSPYPLIGKAFASICLGDHGTAAEVLYKRALKLDPECALAQAFLGMALKRAGFNNEAQQCFDEVLKKKSDEHAVNLVKNLLAEKAS